MWHDYFMQWHSYSYVPFLRNWFSPVGAVLLGLMALWSLIWKGMALWRAAQRGEKRWFVALLLLNTAGILDILYIYVFSKDTQVKLGEKTEN